MVEAAAAAIFLGVDPSWILDEPTPDLPIIERALERASELRTKYDEDLAQAIGARVAQQVVPPLAKQIRSLALAIHHLAKRRTF